MREALGELITAFPLEDYRTAIQQLQRSEHDRFSLSQLNAGIPDSCLRCYHTKGSEIQCDLCGYNALDGNISPAPLEFKAWDDAVHETATDTGRVNIYECYNARERRLHVDLPGQRDQLSSRREAVITGMRIGTSSQNKKTRLSNNFVAESFDTERSDDNHSYSLRTKFVTFCRRLLADDRSTGISGCHFRIQQNWVHETLMLLCSSDRGMRFKSANSSEWLQLRAASRHLRSTSTSECVQQQMLEADSDTLIEIGSSDLRIEIPDRGSLEPNFQVNLSRYYQQHIVRATPNLNGLEVNVPCPDQRHNRHLRDSKKD